MTALKLKRSRRRQSKGTSPLVLLRDEVKALLRDLRVTVKAYAQRLEGDLQRSARILDAAGPADELSREQLHEFREAMMLVRKRKLKPQNGRRKDLRKNRLDHRRSPAPGAERLIARRLNRAA